MSKIINMNNSLFSKNHDADSFSEHELAILGLLGECWSDNTSLFDTDFFSKLFSAIREDVHVKDVYALSNNERYFLDNEIKKLSNATTVKQKRIAGYQKLIENKTINKYTVSSLNIITQLRQALVYDTQLLIIFNHPEQFMGCNLDETTFHDGDNKSMLHDSLKNRILYYNPEDANLADPMQELDPELFSFNYLNNEGVAFSYETPVFTVDNNKDLHDYHWNSVMLDLHINILTIYKDINIITVGCSNKFNEMLEDMSETTSNTITKLDNIFITGDDFLIDDEVADKLGELIAKSLVEMDYSSREPEKLMRIYE
jgi:hypothetical protein